MDLEDLKDEIVAELGQLSGMTASECRSQAIHRPYGAPKPAIGKPEIKVAWIWDLHEDPKKSEKDSDWIAKKATSQKVGEVVLEGTKLYFKPEISKEKMYLADLIEPDSFDKALVALKAALNVANICKTPFGMPMKLPPRFPGRPGRF